MMKKTLILAMSVAAMTTAGSALALEEGELLVWINADKGYNGLQAVGDRLEAELGIPVTVETPDAVTEKFQKEAAIGQGPDIFIWAHDRIGDWAKSGLLAPVEPGRDVRNALDDSFWGAVTYNGTTYGYPMAVEGPTQICNADIVDAPFASWEDVRAAAPGLAENGIAPLLYWYNNAYFNYGVMTVKGGYAFEQINGQYNAKKTGINQPGSIEAMGMIRDLIEDDVMPEGVDYGVFDAAFKNGEVACVINGPWAWGEYEQASIDILVGPYPTLDGEAGQGFTGVLSATINAASPNKDLAIEFIENYLLTQEGLETVNNDRALGAVTHKAFMAELSQDNQTLADAYAIWQAGEPMPNIPEMGAFWSNTEAALTAIVQGRQEAGPALNDAAARIVQ